MEAATLVRIVAGLILLAAVVGKVRAPRLFNDAVREYSLTPGQLNWPVSISVITAEACLCVMLIGGIQLRAALLGAAVLMFLFAGVVTLKLRRGESVECGCLGGSVRLRAGWSLVILNVVLAAALTSASTASVDQAPLPRDGEAISALGVLVIWSSAGLLACLYWLMSYASSVTAGMEEHFRRSAQDRTQTATSA